MFNNGVKMNGVKNSSRKLRRVYSQKYNKLKKRLDDDDRPYFIYGGQDSSHDNWIGMFIESLFLELTKQKDHSLDLILLRWRP